METKEMELTAGLSKLSLDIINLADKINQIKEPNFLDVKTKHLHDEMVLLLSSEINSSQLNEFLRLPVIKNVVLILKEFNATAHRNTEIILGKRFISQSTIDKQLEGSWINPGFKELLNSQIKPLLKCDVIHRIRNIVIIGGGAIPQTQLFLQQYFSGNIFSIEKDEEAVFISRKIIENLGLTKNLRIIHCDGELYDYTNFDLVIIATLVPNKIKIAQSVFCTNNSKFLLLRHPVGLHSVWRENVRLEEILEIGWELVEHILPPKSSVGAYLFKREE